VAKLLIGSKELGGCKNGTASSIIMPSMVVIVVRELAVDEKVMFFVCFFCSSRHALE